MRIFTNVVILHTLFCLLIVLYLAVLNHYYASNTIPMSHVGVVAGIYLGYNVAITYLFWKIWNSSWLQRLFYLFIYALLVLSLFSSVSFLIHDFFPKMGVQLSEV